MVMQLSPNSYTPATEVPAARMTQKEQLPAHLQMSNIIKRANVFQAHCLPKRLNMHMMKLDAAHQIAGRVVLVYANASYAAPVDQGSSFIIRPLAEILRDLNKKVPDQVLKEKPGNTQQSYIPWYQANRMLSFYAPGWCGEVRDITFSADGKFVTVIYRVTIRGSDGEAFREASGTIFTGNPNTEDPTQHAEQMAFVRACTRFGLGLYLHHGEE